MDIDQIAQYRHRLLQRRQELQSSAPDREQADAAVQLDQSRVGRVSRMDALQQQAMHVAAQRLRDAELQSITSALQRIDADTYGLCPDCGDEIAPARLDLNPAALLCIGCAEKRERE